MDSFIRDIGFDTVKTCGDVDTWKENIRGSIRLQIVSESELDRIYRLMRDMICERDVETDCLEEDNSEEAYLYYRDIIILVIHVRLLVIPSMVAQYDIASSAVNDRSFECLENALSDKHKLLQYSHAPSTDNLIECMLDLLEDLSNHNIQNETTLSLASSMLPFIGYYCVINTLEYSRDITFLETYLSEDSPAGLWSAVLLCLLMKKYTTMSVLREYLESESGNTGRISDDVVIIYAAALQSAPNHGVSWMLTNTDYALIIKMRECDPQLFDVRSTLVDNIFKIFIHLCKREMWQSIKKNSACQKIAIKCLCVALPLLRHDNKDDRHIMVTLLKEVRPYVTKNVALTRVAETILYKLCQYISDGLNKLNDEIHEVCHEYQAMKGVSEEIRLSSSELICLTPTVLTSTYDNCPVIKYMSGIINKMKMHGRESLLGYSVSQLENALTQLEAVTPTPSRNTGLSRAMVFKGHLGSDHDKNHFSFIFESADSEIDNKFKISFDKGSLKYQVCHSELWQLERTRSVVVMSDNEEFRIVVQPISSSKFEVLFNNEYMDDYELKGSTLKCTIEGGVQFDDVTFEERDVFNFVGID